MEWEIRDGTWEIKVTIPEGITAELRLPGVDAASLVLNGIPSPPFHFNGRNAVMVLGSGSNAIRVKTRF
jgi:hypothetical protein